MTTAHAGRRPSLGEGPVRCLARAVSFPTARPTSERAQFVSDRLWQRQLSVRRRKRSTELDSTGDLLKLTDKLRSVEAIAASSEFRYRQLRSRHSNLLAWWLTLALALAPFLLPTIEDRSCAVLPADARSIQAVFSRPADIASPDQAPR